MGATLPVVRAESRAKEFRTKWLGIEGGNQRNRAGAKEDLPALGPLTFGMPVKSVQWGREQLSQEMTRGKQGI